MNSFGVVVVYKVEFVDFIGVVFCFQFLFGFVDVCDFWVGVDDVWNNVIVYVICLIGDNFGGGYVFVFGFVGQYWVFDCVVNGVNVCNIGVIVVVDFDLIVFGYFNV